jgi:hypothetical protein
MNPRLSTWPSRCATPTVLDILRVKEPKDKEKMAERFKAGKCTPNFSALNLPAMRVCPQGYPKGSTEKLATKERIDRKDF